MRRVDFDIIFKKKINFIITGIICFPKNLLLRLLFYWVFSLYWETNNFPDFLLCFQYTCFICFKRYFLLKVYDWFHSNLVDLKASYPWIILYLVLSLLLLLLIQVKIQTSLSTRMHRLLFSTKEYFKCIPGNLPIIWTYIYLNLFVHFPTTNSESPNKEVFKYHFLTTRI